MTHVEGQRGNPAGRPRGSRNRTTLALEAQLEARAEEIVDLAIRRALTGDMASLRLCLDRILPRGRERPLPFALPPTTSAADTKRAVADIWSAVAAGEITTREALDLLALVEKSVRLVEAAHAAERAAPKPFDPAAYYDPALYGGNRPTENTTKNNEPPGPMTVSADFDRKEGPRPGHREAGDARVHASDEDDPLASATNLQTGRPSEHRVGPEPGDEATPAPAGDPPVPSQTPIAARRDPFKPYDGAPPQRPDTDRPDGSLPPESPPGPHGRHADGPGPGYDPNHPYFRNR